MNAHLKVNAHLIYTEALTGVARNFFFFFFTPAKMTVKHSDTVGLSDRNSRRSWVYECVIGHLADDRTE